LRVLLFLLALIVPAEASPATLDALVERARSQGLADTPRWHTLLHYERRHFTTIRRSVASGDAFLLASDGARDPEAELVATLAGLLDPTAHSARGEPIRCAFPARAAFLAEALGFEPAPGDCPELDAWRARLRPTGLTLVFPEAFMDSPASMFGHTLLRLDVGAPDDAAQSLLGWAIDFTADTGGEAGPIYLLKGVFGRYPGRFGLNPFWEKLKQYADWQNRDLWEYRIDLTPEEIDFVLLHLWELRDVSFPYYFFDENCSYHLVRLVQAARPDIAIGHGFPVSITPIDTVRDVITRTGTIGEPRFRASPATRIRFALRSLPDDEVNAFRDLASGERAPDDPELAAWPPERRARVLGLAYDSLRYRFLDQEVPAPEARARAHALLLARSRLGLPALALEPPPPRIRPEQGHGTAMLGLAGGLEDGEPHLDFRVRPALHGLRDPGGGHSPDSTIRVLDGTLRYYPALGRVRLHELTLVELRSEAPIDRFFHPPSWHIRTGLATRLRPEDGGEFDREPVWRSEGGAGATFARGDWLRATVLASLRAETGGSLDHNAAFGPGLAASLHLGRPGDRGALRLGAEAFRFVAGDRATVIAVRAEPTLRLSRRFALVGGVGWNQDEGERWLDGRLELRVYY